MSHYGVARDLLAALKFKKQIGPNINLSETAKRNKFKNNRNKNRH